ncbi:unnamed protein product, partial [Effrenium voratum]
MMKSDTHFSSLPEGLCAEEIQTLGHLLHTRTFCDLLPSASAVEEAFEVHRRSLEVMHSLGKSLACAAAEWKAGRRALQKAKELEARAMEKEKERAEKARQKEAERQAKKQQKEAEEATQQQQQQQGQPADNAHAGPKKRRVASKLAAELTDSDYRVLRERFPDKEIPVVDSVAAAVSMIS